ncbi:MAG: hypothetical protein NZ932_05820 [Candidatus Bathyarchaeota archaeon]|nr:hypothetical protein [Candidatus Bathyarchaeota archaeon]
MPAISIDTFFACSLMVLLVLSAMSATAKILQPLINTSTNVEAARRLSEVAKRILLYAGKPADWGQWGQLVPEEFGLADVGADNPYALDVDKVSRLNRENAYCLSYAQIFTSLKAPDLMFRIEIKPVFAVKLNLTAVFEGSDKKVYTFEVATLKDDGVQVSAILKAYVLAGNLLKAHSFQKFDGWGSFNITVPKYLESPFALVVFAKSAHNSRLASYAVYTFTQNGEPAQEGAFLRLSPLNQTLTVTPMGAGVVLEKVYALTFSRVWQLTRIESNIFSVPASVDSCPTVLVAVGSNATKPLIEWTAYPQIPLKIGVDFANLPSASDIYVYEHLVSIGYGTYKCTIFLGRPKL